jgi:hypothetical protein
MAVDADHRPRACGANLVGIGSRDTGDVGGGRGSRCGRCAGREGSRTSPRWTQAIGGGEGCRDDGPSQTATLRRARCRQTPIAKARHAHNRYEESLGERVSPRNSGLSGTSDHRSFVAKTSMESRTLVRTQGQMQHSGRTTSNPDPVKPPSISPPPWCVTSEGSDPAVRRCRWVLTDSSAFIDPRTLLVRA